MNGIHAPCSAAIYANPQLCSSHSNSHSHSHCTANGHKFNGGIDTIYSAPTLSNHTSIPHSKPLEQYHEAPAKVAYHHQHSYPARHSLDKPNSNAYDFNGHSYDCLDGASVGHRINDHYALPVHVESHYAQIAPSANVYDQMPAPPYSHTYATPYQPPRNNCSCNNDHRLSSNVRQMPNEYHNYQPLPASVCEVHGKMYAKSNNGGRAHGFEPYLINFDDKPTNGDRNIVDDSPDYDYRRHHDSAYVKSHYNQYDVNSKSSSNDIKGHSALSLKYAERNRHPTDYDDYTHNNDYVPHSESKRSSALKNYARNKKLLGEYEEHFDAHESRNSRQSDFDSFDSGNNLSIERELGSRGAMVDQTTSSKIRDGVGSYETWNYVFQNIGKNGYNKVSNCDADDLTVQGLDLNAVPVPVTTEKRRSRHLDANECVAMPKQTNGTGTANRKMVAGDSSGLNGCSNHRKTVSVEVNGMPKSMLKQTTAAAIATSAPPPSNGVRENGQNSYETNGDIGKKSNFKMTNGGNISTMLNGSGQFAQVMPSPAVVSSTRNDSQPQADEIRNASNEWSCKFCTFLNPVHLHICQMCFKSQDFVIDVPKASTCV